MINRKLENSENRNRNTDEEQNNISHISGGDLMSTSNSIQGKKPLPFFHNPWSISMHFSTLLKGLVITATLLIMAVGAQAQLPVRTQYLQLINPIAPGGTLTHQNNGASADSYIINWPSNSDHSGAVANVDGDQAFLIGTYVLATDQWNLRWEENDGFVDGSGALNHVAYWNPDDQTLHYTTGFEWDGSVLGVGMNNTPGDPDALGNPLAGQIQIGSGGAAPVAQVQLNVVAGEGTFGAVGTAGSVLVASAAGATSVDLDGGTATATVGNAAIAGTVNVTDATGVNSGVIAGATGTLTMGNNAAAPISGEIVLHDGSANTVTINPNAQAVDVPLTVDQPTAGPVGPATTFFVTPIRNQAAAGTNGYVLVSQADGTAEWESSAAQYVQSGITAMSTGTYTQSVVFPTDYSTLNPPVPAGQISVVLVTNGLAADANILQVTNISVTGFDVLSSAPLSVASINWIAVGRP